MVPSAIPAFTPGLSVAFCTGAGVMLVVDEAIDEVIEEVLFEVVTEVKVLQEGTTVGVAVGGFG